MISYISGKVLNIGDGFIEVLLANGVGYTVFIPSSTLSYEIDSPIELYISMQVREDSQKLYGFDSRLDRDTFIMLISVSGIGPKIGLAILNMYSKEEVSSLIMSGDYKRLSRVSGLGSKGSQKIILDLKEKIGNLGIDTVLVSGSNVDKSMTGELRTALKSLGFLGENLSAYEQKGVEVLTDNPDITIELLLKYVLSGK